MRDDGLEQKFSKKSAPATLMGHPERHDRTPGAVAIVDAEAVERIVARQREINRHYEFREPHRRGGARILG